MRRLTIPLLISLMLAACSTPEDTRPGQPVKHRQQAFKDILKSFEPMGTMLRDDRYDPEKFASLATALNSQRDVPWPYFAADTNYPPSKAKAEVWSQAAEFDKARQAFMTSSEQLIAAVQSKDKAVIEKRYKETYETCQSCHRQFRDR